MSESKFKTLRHIEAVRNYLNAVVVELLKRSSLHDQSKLETPEVEIFEEMTPKLREMKFGSDEYKAALEYMEPALQHHYIFNRHHPEHFVDGMMNMNLIDLIEMLCDWKASGKRHKDGLSLHQSIEMNQSRFKYSDEVKILFLNTADFLETVSVQTHAEES